MVLFGHILNLKSNMSTSINKTVAERAKRPKNLAQGKLHKGEKTTDPSLAAQGNTKQPLPQIGSDGKD